MVDFSVLVVIGLLIGWALMLAMLYSLVELSDGAIMMVFVLMFTWLTIFTFASIVSGFTNVAPERYYGPSVGGFRGNVVERAP